MGQSGGETEHRPRWVTGKLTRRPKRRRKWFLNNSVKGVGDFAMPGLEVAEVPIIGPIILVIFAIVAVALLAILFGGLLIAFIEVTIVGSLALAGSLWAWLRGHPKVPVIDVDDQRWVRYEGPAVDIIADQRTIRAGADPASLGYQQLS